MIKSKSWSQVEYEFTYRQMRRGFSPEKIYENDEVAPGHIKAADYSMRNHGHWFSGWISEERRKRFHAILYRILTTSEGIPF